MEKTRDPQELLAAAGIKLHTSKEILGKDLETNAGWKTGRIAAPLADDASLTGHWGGGANIAGEDIEVPEMTWREKLLYVLGKVKTTLRGWLRYHEGKGFATIAYTFWISRWGRSAGVLRGWRQNGGQWGDVNKHTAAIVFVLGLGQTIQRGAWRMFAAFWFAAGAPDTPDDTTAQIAAGKFPGGMRAHRHWNGHPQSKSTTSCCGNDHSAKLAAEYPATKLPRLKVGMVRNRGRWVRLWNARMVELGFLPEMVRRYNWKAEAATIAMQKANPDCGRRDGVVDAQSWRTGGKLVAVAAA